MRARLRRFGPGERGLALVEFAIALPVLLLLYLGGWQLSDALACKRKVTITGRALADLTSQYASLTTGQTTSILNAATQTMAPYSTSNFGAVVSELYTDNNGVTTVVWSQAGGLGWVNTCGAVYPLPATMVSNNTYLILAQVRYIYTPVAPIGIVGQPLFGDDIYMSPRVSSSVTHPSC